MGLLPAYNMSDSPYISLFYRTAVQIYINLLDLLKFFKTADPEIPAKT